MKNWYRQKLVLELQRAVRSTAGVETMNLTEFEQLTAEQIAIECGKDKPTEQNIIDAVRIVTRCNANRVNAGLEEIE